MLVRPRRARFRLTALIAAAAVLCATDARLSHLGHRHEPAALAEVADADACALGSGCSPEGLRLDEVCGCCSPASPARPEPDGRPTPASLKGKADLGLASSTMIATLDRPTVAASVHASIAVPAASRRPLYLLNGRLLF